MSEDKKPTSAEIISLDQARSRLRHTFYGVVENVGTEFVNDAKDILVTVSFAGGLVDESYYIDRTLLFKGGREILLTKGAVINFNVSSGFENWEPIGNEGKPVNTGMGFQRMTAIRLVNNS
ncbi:MAG: hypothetical protein EBQ96_06290 [Proteobacteria bacterium]|nr:hypothetical protein [Pseudomonadota bacterium]